MALIPHASESGFVCVNVSKVSLAFDFLPGTFGFVLALVQVRLSGYAAAFGGLVRGLGF